MESWRVALFGDGGVGKTGLATQTYDPTLEDVYRKQLVVDNKICSVEVIDIPQETEHYGLVLDQLIIEGQAFLLIYSIASRSSFDRIEIYRQAILRVKGPNPIFVLVGTKSDKAAEREVSKEDGAALARSFGCTFEETSAKTAQNVEQLFTCLVRNMRDTNMRDTNMRDTKPSEEKKKPKHKCQIF
ncbi:ras protein [Athelia psychrophila]|uniref:Ras protein n=1 Tax=Athelia psychrophila TaxID=1759441 RepID=A0A166EV52_9AGAM|nr:ras protein [Fibularhizoctonia sp. CBS 109695]